MKTHAFVRHNIPRIRNFKKLDDSSDSENETGN
jgi:hypothetical protein